MAQVAKKCIAVVATDAPLLPNQLKRVARRVSLGLARTGTISGNGSGDLFIAFSTANPNVANSDQVMHTVQTIPNDLLDSLFTGVVQATEEAVVNALVDNQSMTGRDNHQVEALSHDRLRELVNTGQLQVFEGFPLSAVTRMADGLVVTSHDRTLPAVDEIVAATGFRPDLDMLREVRLDLDAIIESPRTLAPLIDPNLHSCGTVPPHGAEELQHPERDFFVVGMKSYGRAPTFLLRTGYEQVRSVVAALAGDWEAARNVELVLPETGVCSTKSAPAEATETAACCGAGSTRAANSSARDTHSAAAAPCPCRQATCDRSVAVTAASVTSPSSSRRSNASRSSSPPMFSVKLRALPSARRDRASSPPGLNAAASRSARTAAGKAPIANARIPASRSAAAAFGSRSETSSPALCASSIAWR